MSINHKNNIDKIIGLLIVVAVAAFLFGLYFDQWSNKSLNIDTYTTHKNISDELSFVNKVFQIYLIVFHSIDTARATYFLIDEHSVILETLNNTNIKISTNLKNIMLSRQKYFADRTVQLLDLALTNANDLKPVGNVSDSDITLLQSKVAELKQLAVQLRTIAYKYNLTENDVDNAQAIVENMESIASDIGTIVKQMINNS